VAWCHPQGKLTALEDTHAAVLGSYREGQAALEGARGEASRLGREAGQLAALVEKLEDRCACSSVVSVPLLPLYVLLLAVWQAGSHKVGVHVSATCYMV
jgi:hypothetical protein